MFMKTYYNKMSILLFMLSFSMLMLTLMSSFNDNLFLFEWNLEFMNSSNFNFNILIDKYSLIFSSSVLFISANVLLFSNSYMISEKENNRFLLIMILFILSMNLLIFIPNLIFLLIGWDGLGLVSFLLVIHYPSNKSLAAGMITVLTNRIGDVLILISIPLLFSSMNWNPSVYMSENSMLIAILIIMAAMTKSAQIPFSSWLPAAMAAPTPISALVHSSTLVTAGVFLLFRFYPSISSHNSLNSILLFSSSLTMLMAGIIALKENDMKKIIALSTLSQLGVMMFSLAMNLPNLTFFHLITHATFKALLFIGAGNLILQINHSQDIRHFGNLNFYYSMTSSTMMIANMALIGFPFMAGFYSKDLIIEMCMFNSMNIYMFITLFIATMLTLLYSMRFTFLLFSNISMTTLFNPSSMDKNMNFPMIIMGIYVIFSGALINWMVIMPIYHPSMSNYLKILISLSLLLIFTMFITYMIYKKFLNKFNMSPKHFILSMLYSNFLTAQFSMKNILPISINFYKKFDSSWNEMMLGKFLPQLSNKISLPLMSWQNSIITTNFILIICLIYPMI